MGIDPAFSLQIDLFILLNKMRVLHFWLLVESVSRDPASIESPIVRCDPLRMTRPRTAHRLSELCIVYSGYFCYNGKTVRV